MEKSGIVKHDNLNKILRIILTILMIFGVIMALWLRDIVDTTFFFVSLTMSLGFLIVILWIYPKLNKYSVNLSIIFCLIGVILPALFIGISTSLVIYAIVLCIAGLVIGLIYYLIFLL